jgi:branched-subunit amino acid aminotransferase/4-amino-4-deoxychorismate lyase
MLALLDGIPSDHVPGTDSTVLRGDGVFEAIRSYGSRLFALGPHLDRMGAGAAAMELPLPERRLLERWCTDMAEGDAIVRVVVSRGDAVPGLEGPPRCLVLRHPLPDTPSPFVLEAVPAPWHPAGRSWELAGVKTTSYAPNLAAGRRARAAGASDALLVSDDGAVLEGPTFSVGWVRDGVLETPGLELGILASITRRVVLELAGAEGIEVRTGRFPLARVLESDELLVWSTVKEVTPVSRLGERTFVPGPVGAFLAERFSDRVAAVTGHDSRDGVR